MPISALVVGAELYFSENPPSQRFYLQEIKYRKNKDPFPRNKERGGVNKADNQEMQDGEETLWHSHGDLHETLFLLLTAYSRTPAFSSPTFTYRRSRLEIGAVIAVRTFFGQYVRHKTCV